MENEIVLLLFTGFTSIVCLTYTLIYCGKLLTLIQSLEKRIKSLEETQRNNTNGIIGLSNNMNAFLDAINQVKK